MLKEHHYMCVFININSVTTSSNPTHAHTIYIYIYIYIYIWATPQPNIPPENPFFALFWAVLLITLLHTISLLFPTKAIKHSHQTIELCPPVAQSNPYIFEHNAVSRLYELLGNNPFLK